jgi:nucleoside-triphosphatase
MDRPRCGYGLRSPPAIGGADRFVMVKILLEGRPGVGKTTLAIGVVDALADRGVEVSGITTKELRERGRRVGFLIEAIGGRREVMAHVDYSGPPRVGKYGVDLEALEGVALPEFEQRSEVLVIDELGKMELHSQALCDAVTAAMQRDGHVVATVQASAHPFTDALKSREDVDLIQVSRANRDELRDRVVAALV